MIPKIKPADDFIKNTFGVQYLVGKNNSWDMCDNFGTAIRYWLWWCGVPAKIAFWKLKFKK